METRWMYRRSEDFSELREAVARTCVIPMGCVEKHGLHLPLGTDIMHASKIACMAHHGLAQYILENGPESVPEMTKEDIKLVLKYHAENMRVGHACFGETAYIMGLYPETVRLDRLGIESGLPTGAPDYLKEVGIHIADGGWIHNYPNHYDGHDPVDCNERIGKAALRLEAERVARAYKVLKEDKYLLRWLEESQEGWGVKERV